LEPASLRDGCRPCLLFLPWKPCPGETLAHLQHETLEQTLGAVFTDGPLRLQAEACAALASAQTCLPRQLLPKALDAGKRSVLLRTMLLPVLGQRGAWLAAQNSDWAYAIGAATDALDMEAWDHGSLDQRKLLLRALRQQDPAKARERMSEAFATEGARERSGLMAELKTGLSLDDESLSRGCAAGQKQGSA